MSRAERERWELGEAQWPNLQGFLSQQFADYLFGDIKALQAKLQEALRDLSFQQRSDIASECWAFLKTFKDRHDDRPFLRDGLGVRGGLANDDRGRGQTGLARAKLVYDAFAASLRSADQGWRPSR